MEFRNLKTFQLATEYLNFTKAAQELNFTQPTVTAQIQSLEQELDQQLFMRVGKKTFLTPAGEILKHYADQIFELIEETKSALSELDLPNGKISIAASETFCTHYFPTIISTFMSHHPNVNIKLLSCHTKEVIEGITANKFDIGIISGTLDKNGITNIPIAEENLVLVVSRNLFKDYSVEELLEAYPFIKYQIDGAFNDQMQKFIQEANLTPAKVIEFSSLEAVKRAVLNQIGLGLISENLVKKELVDGDLVQLSLNRKPVKIITSLITLEEKTKMTTIGSFIDVVQKMWNKIHTFD